MEKGTLADLFLNKHLGALVKAFVTHERVCQGEKALPRAQPHKKINPPKQCSSNLVYL